MDCKYGQYTNAIFLVECKCEDRVPKRKEKEREKVDEEKSLRDFTKSGKSFMLKKVEREEEEKILHK